MKYLAMACLMVFSVCDSFAQSISMKTLDIIPPRYVYEREGACFEIVFPDDKNILPYRIDVFQIGSECTVDEDALTTVGSTPDTNWSLLKTRNQSIYFIRNSQASISYYKADSSGEALQQREQRIISFQDFNLNRKYLIRVVGIRVVGIKDSLYYSKLFLIGLNNSGFKLVIPKVIWSSYWKSIKNNKITTIWLTLMILIFFWFLRKYLTWRHYDKKEIGSIFVYSFIFYEILILCFLSKNWESSILLCFLFGLLVLDIKNFSAKKGIKKFNFIIYSLLIIVVAIVWLLSKWHLCFNLLMLLLVVLYRIKKPKVQRGQGEKQDLYPIRKDFHMGTNLFPMIGFAGTIVGLILQFHPSILATEALGVALYTTLAGLLLGGSSILIENQINKIIGD